MDLWQEFIKSGKIEDYLKYKHAPKNHPEPEEREPSYEHQDRRHRDS